MTSTSPDAGRPAQDRIPVPQLTRADVVFGEVKHLPKWDDIPAEFKRSSNPYARFVSGWFFSGRKPKDMARLTARDGVDRAAALGAIQAVLGSFAPKHEHKEAGAAYLLSEWFELDRSAG